MSYSHVSLAQLLVRDHHRQLERLAGQSRLRREAHKHRHRHR